MMLRIIQSALALPGSCIRLVWADRSESVVDLGPVLAKGGVFASLRDLTRSARSRWARAAAH